MPTGAEARQETGYSERLRIRDYVRPSRSPIRVLFTSGSSAGSWQIRGEQIAQCRGNWHAERDIEPADTDRFDVVCVVKRHERLPLDSIKRRGKLIVFDVVDSWAQPDDGVACPNLQAAQALFLRKWESLPADGYIFPNRCMWRHFRRFVPFSTYIYHHFHPSLSPITIRRQVHRLGYEGNPNYLGPWREVIEEICRRKGIEFVINPESLMDVDLGIAARGGVHDSFLANMYKSNVKLANCYGAGLPCVMTAKDRSYHETDQGDVRFFANASQLETQIDALLDYETRRRTQERFVAMRGDFAIAQMADVFERFFMALLRRYQSAPGVRLAA